MNSAIMLRSGLSTVMMVAMLLQAGEARALRVYVAPNGDTSTYPNFHAGECIQ